MGSMINANVFVYQQFSDLNSPKPPFIAKIEGETALMWKAVYQDLEDRTIRKFINKGCCSSNPVNTGTFKLRLKKSGNARPVIKRAKFDNFKNPYKET